MCNKNIKILPSPVKKLDSNLNENQIEIPSDFIDELTHEMMRMPIRLPSNKYVDKTTLDKYLNEKRKANEQEKDPFTNVPFSSNYKPIIDEILKSKIDKFLFDNHTKKLVYKEIVRNEKRKLNDSNSDTCESKQQVKKSKSSLEISTRSCNSCLNIKNSAKSLYELTTCKHSYCRNCLQGMANKCVICKIEFKSNHVIHTDRLYLDK